MSLLNEQASLKSINEMKKKINWGDVPAIFHLVSSSLGDLDGILTHGFDSAFKRILNPDTWNLSLLEAREDKQGRLMVKHKPKIILRHEYNDMGYELHCYPVLHTNHPESNLFVIGNPKVCSSYFALIVWLLLVSFAIKVVMRLMPL